MDGSTTYINCCATGELGWCQRPLDENGDPISSTPCDVIPDGATTSVKHTPLADGFSRRAAC